MGDNSHVAGIFTASFAIRLVLVALEAKEKTADLLPEYRSLCPELFVSTYNKCTFWWLNPFLLAGFRKTLTIKDVYKIHPKTATNVVGKRLQEWWLKCGYKSLELRSPC